MVGIRSSEKYSLLKVSDKRYVVIEESSYSNVMTACFVNGEIEHKQIGATTTYRQYTKPLSLGEAKMGLYYLRNALKFPKEWLNSKLFKDNNSLGTNSKWRKSHV